jgi:hypothetical protein
MKAAAGDSWAPPPKAIIKGTRKGTTGGKKGQKQCPRCSATTTSDNGDDEKAGTSSEEHVTTTERDFKRQVRQLKDHFEKLLEVTCLNHSYPVKHKLKDYTMLKN